MQTFQVRGPFPVEFHGTALKRVETEHAKVLWQGKAAPYAYERGVYLLAVKASRNYTPIYVGKATKSFAQEVLGWRNLQNLNQVLFHRRKGKPAVFLVVQRRAPGRSKASVIAEVERYLIQTAKEANEKLLNVHHSREVITWQVDGVGTRKRGHPGKPVVAFRRMLRLGNI